jgi:hypothetical protein
VVYFALKPFKTIKTIKNTLKTVGEGWGRLGTVGDGGRWGDGRGTVGDGDGDGRDGDAARIGTITVENNTNRLNFKRAFDWCINFRILKDKKFGQFLA